jgi:hypothetical protein
LLKYSAELLLEERLVRMIQAGGLHVFWFARMHGSGTKKKLTVHFHMKQRDEQ